MPKQGWLSIIADWMEREKYRNDRPIWNGNKFVVVIR